MNNQTFEYPREDLDLLTMTDAVQEAIDAIVDCQRRVNLPETRAKASV